MLPLPELGATVGSFEIVDIEGLALPYTLACRFCSERFAELSEFDLLDYLFVVCPACHRDEDGRLPRNER